MNVLWTVAYDMWVVGGMDGITDTRLDLVNIRKYTTLFLHLIFSLIA